MKIELIELITGCLFRLSSSRMAPKKLGLVYNPIRNTTDFNKLKK